MILSLCFACLVCLFATTVGQQTCAQGGMEYQDGDSVPSEDCNTCFCANGVVACSKMLCPPSTCQYYGQEYQNGEPVPSEDCNTCFCANGVIACSKMLCPPCVYNGQTYVSGDVFTDVDGCNICRCIRSEVACTKMACPPPQ